MLTRLWQREYGHYTSKQAGDQERQEDEADEKLIEYVDSEYLLVVQLSTIWGESSLLFEARQAEPNAWRSRSHVMRNPQHRNQDIA